MKYISTRGASPLKSFSEVLLAGLAEDGGLYVPQEYPHISADTLDKWRDLSYPELAFEIMRLFIDDIHEPVIRFLVEKTYCAENFGSDDITPVRRLNDGVHILGLSNGPTLAFKDIAMQFLGNAFEYVLTHKKKTLNIIGATSGDTGSAAEYAMRGKRGIRVFMLSPAGKMSAFQRAQMYSLQDNNIFNIAVDSMFDDCQDIVKAIQNDAAFKEQYSIGTVNSINWARVMAQVVYYFKSYFEVTGDNDEKVSFCVPSGNFGDICAGHVAKQMGLPIDRLIVATNENDVLDEFFQSGVYRPRAARDVIVTSTPSMDIAKASNLERFVFDLVRRDPEQVKALWAEIETGKTFDLKRKLKAMKTFYGFDSGKCTHNQRIETIRQVWAEDGQVIDPHTATAVYIARQIKQPTEKMVCMETALPAKFDDTIKEALGQDFAVPRPDNYIGIEDKPQKVVNMPNNVTAVKMFMKENIPL